MIPAVGAILAGKYRVDRILGQGGMGVVVQAMHMQLHQPVAMKFLLPEILGNHELVHRFLREAQAAVRLKNEHVARVIDVGTLETGAPFMVLEYLDGTDLAHMPRHQLSPGVVVDLMLQACEALAEAHASGIIHRDVKPANFFITRRSDGSLLLKVLDFGISKAQFGTEGNLTATQSVMGTPAYMSPEQMRSAKGVDARSDIWALGAVMYELLQGTQPFEADSFSAMCLKVAMDPHGPLTVPLPPGLDQVVYACLAKDPAQRFQNVAELAAALAPYAQTPTQAMVSVDRAARTLGRPTPQIGGPYAGHGGHGGHAPGGHAGHGGHGGHTGHGGPSPSGVHGRSSPSTLSAATGATLGGGAPASSRWPLVAGIAIVAIAAVALAVVLSGGGEKSPAAGATLPTAESADAATTATLPPAAIDAGAAAIEAPPVTIDAGAAEITATAATDAGVDAPRAKRTGRTGKRAGGGTGKSTGGGDDDVLDTRY